MASNLKRRRATVSYKEPSSDEDISGESAQEYASSKKRAAPQRRSARQRPLDTERTLATRTRRGTDAAYPASASRVRNVQLRERRKVSYRESSTASGPESDSEDYEATPPPVQREGNPSSVQAKKEKDSRRRRSRALGASFKPKIDMYSQHTTAAPQRIVSDSIIPAWSTLPYHVLLQVFVYASHPLHDENLTPTPSIAWLARTARMCSAFARPALTALYRNPPIFAIRQNRRMLVQHLVSPPPNPYANYSVMVKRLELDATKMSQLTDSQSSASDLAALISSLGNLRELDIFDPFDKPPYRERSRHMRRWYYPDELFVALRQSELRLQSWRWNSTYCAQGLPWMKEVHTSPAFRSLREVTLTKFHPKTAPKSADDEPTTEELLGSTLAALPNLKSLTFETCSALNERLLPLLPNNLVALNITNCRDVTSEALEAFLATHGSLLEGLTLNHNQSLDLSFLVGLKQYSPRLEVLRMDLNYYNTLSTSSDNEPLYDYLLGEGEIPSWPSTLRIIDLEFLRNWSATTAVAFFTSLIDSAGELPWLREITITAIVDIDWRQRAEFRRKWTDRFQKVFARKLIPPDPNLVSLRAFGEWKTRKHPGTGKIDSPIQGISGKAGDYEESESDVPLISSRNRQVSGKWGSQRLRSRAKASIIHSDASSSDEESEDDVGFVQGGCYKVAFRIDNSRPQEQIYNEEDFLDEEASGDEDWDGVDVVDDGYAW